MHNEENSFSNIVQVYETNIGLLTSAITDKLLIASRIYSYDLIIEAIMHAKDNQRRNWTYVQGYLDLKTDKKNNTRKENMSNAKSTRFSFKSKDRDDPYKSVIKRTWSK